jgi:phosphohistidine phosphatase SixA
MGYVWANLDKEGKKTLQTLEDKLGKRILAIYPDFVPAKISDDELKQIQAVEKKLKVDLVAVVSH